MRNILLASGVVISFVSIGMVVMEPTSISPIDEKIKTNSDVIKAQSIDTDIVYEKRSNISVSSVKTVMQQKLAKTEIKRVKKPKNPYEKYVTFDRKKQYRIALVDQYSKEKATGVQRALRGSIDGIPFSVSIPESILQNELKLRMTHLKTKKVIEIDLPFVSDLTEQKIAPLMKIVSTDPDNFSIEYYDSKVLPFP